MAVDDALDAYPAPAAPGPRRPARRAILAVGSLAMLLVLVALLRIGWFVPLAALLSGVLVFWAATNPRFGLVASISSALLVPLPLGFKIGPFTISIGRLLAFAFIFGWVAALSRPDGPRLRRGALGVKMAGVIAAFALSIAANAYRLTNADFGAAVRAGLVFGVDFFVFYYASVSVLSAGRRHVDWALRVICVTVVAIAVLGVVERITGRNVFDYPAPLLPARARAYVIALTSAAHLGRGTITRVRSTLEGPNQLGAVLTMTLPLLLHYSTVARTWVRKTGWMIGVAVCVLTGILTGSRSVIIGFVLVLVLYGIATRRVRPARQRVGFTVFASIVVLLALPQVRATLVVYFRGLATLQERSVQSRVVQSKLVFDQVDHTPILGRGPATFRRQELLARGVDIGDKLALDNSYLGALAELGIVGLLATIALLWGAVLIAGRGLQSARDGPDRSLRAALFAGITVFAVLSYFFDMLQFYGPPRLYFLLVAAAVVLSGRAVLPTDDLAVRPEAVARTDASHPLSVLFRRRRVAALTTVAVIAVSAGPLLLKPRQYVASAELLIGRSELFTTRDNGADQFRALQLELPTIAQRIVGDSALGEAATQARWPGGVETLRAHVAAIPVPNQLVIKVLLASSDATVATSTVNALIAGAPRSVSLAGASSSSPARTYDVTPLQGVTLTQTGRTRPVALDVFVALALAGVAAFVAEAADTLTSDPDGEGHRVH